MKRKLNGIFLLDKPKGVSSNHVLQSVKRLYKADKAGHTGSLDPLATGMLPICFGEATKYSQHLLDADKCYEVTAKLGVRTDTGDSEGRVLVNELNRSEKVRLLAKGGTSTEGWVPEARELTESLAARSFSYLSSVLKKFTGPIEQIPPMYSALKYQGRPLYEYARKGETIVRNARQVTIYSIELIHQTIDEISLRVHCSKGTYIRTLIDDIGEVLGCGAHVIALRRLWVAPFQEEKMMTLHALEQQSNPDSFLHPIDAALRHWRKHSLDANQAKRLQQGLPLFILDALPGFVRFYDHKDDFLGVGKIESTGEVTDKRLVSCVFDGIDNLS